jgi:hypothetical protein
MSQKVVQHIITVFFAIIYTKIVYVESFIKAKIRILIRSQTSGFRTAQKCPDQTGSATLELGKRFFLTFQAQKEKKFIARFQLAT